MSYLRRLKGFIEKDYFDFERPDINLYNFHPQLRILLIVNGIFFNNRNSRIRLIWPGGSILLCMLAVCLESMFIYHGLTTKDYSFATECFCCFVLLGTMPVVSLSVLKNKDNILDLIENMNETFIYIRRLESKYRNSFLEGQLIIWKFYNAWLIFCCIVCGTFFMFPVFVLMYQSLFPSLDEDTTRPLVFPIWLPKLDGYSTPIYEIFLILEINYCLIFLQTFCVYIYTLFHILLHFYYILHMIKLDLEAIFDDIDESVALLPHRDTRRIEVQKILNGRMKRVVTWHISVFKAVEAVSSIYGPPLAYQVMFTSIAICLIAIQITQKLENGILDIRFTMLGVAACLQMWIPCYLGTLLRNKAFGVGEACWNSGWHQTPLGRMIRQDIIIVLLRAQQPVTIKFPGLQSIQLETFSSIMTTSYSYFNMLRQYS
ncbi:odorant receptor 13a-like [Bombyx mori]|uniref:Odorant receptor n=1 Tax=Bombyx mori TaxID=7091 RepID=A0A8R2QTZ8_BOMMO|nr:odorant receptor 13a-like [Bombyx mori]XP_037877403.1 olfactory receptor 65 isoform X1 [Bombyx mori]